VFEKLPWPDIGVVHLKGPNKGQCETLRKGGNRKFQEDFYFLVNDDMDSYADHNEPGGEGRDGEVGVTLAEVVEAMKKGSDALISAQVKTTFDGLLALAKAISQYGRYNYVFDEHQQVPIPLRFGEWLALVPNVESEDGVRGGRRILAARRGELTDLVGDLSTANLLGEGQWPLISDDVDDQWELSGMAERSLKGLSYHGLLEGGVTTHAFPQASVVTPPSNKPW
jgi:hypothetical protein